MKLKLLICGAASVLLAGCAGMDHYASAATKPFYYDLVPSPLPGLTSDQLAALYTGEPIVTVGFANPLLLPTPDTVH